MFYKWRDKGENARCRGKYIEFNQYYQQQVAPYCIYADFESVIKQKSEVKSLHKISGYSLCVKSPYEKAIIIEGMKQGDILFLTFKAWVKSQRARKEKPKMMPMKSTNVPQQGKNCMR